MSSHALSSLGNAAVPVALTFAVLGPLGGGVREVSLTVLARAVGQIGGLMVAGVVADNARRNIVITASDGLASASLFALAAAVFYQQSFSFVLIAAAMNGITSAFFLPATTSLVASLCTDGRSLTRLNAALRISATASLAAGALMAGLISGSVGEAGALAVAGCCYLMSSLTIAVALRGLDADRHLELFRTVNPREQVVRLVLQYREGWRTFIGTSWIFAIVAQFSLINALQAGGLMVLGPVLFEQRNYGPVGWSVVLAAQSVGFLLGALLMIKIRVSRPILLAVASTATLAPVFLCLALDTGIVVLAAVSMLAGIGGSVFTVCWTTSLQLFVDQRMLGRISSYDALGSYALGPIGIAVLAPLAEVVGAETLLVASFAFILFSTLAVLCVPTVLRASSSSMDRDGSW